MCLNGFLLKPRFCAARWFGCPKHPQPRCRFLCGRAHRCSARPSESGVLLAGTHSLCQEAKLPVAGHALPAHMQTHHRAADCHQSSSSFQAGLYSDEQERQGRSSRMELLMQGRTNEILTCVCPLPHPQPTS